MQACKHGQNVFACLCLRTFDDDDDDDEEDAASAADDDDDDADDDADAILAQAILRREPPTSSTTQGKRILPANMPGATKLTYSVDASSKELTLSGCQVGRTPELSSKVSLPVTNAIVKLHFGQKCVDTFFAVVAKITPRKLGNLLAGFISSSDAGVTTRAQYADGWKYVCDVDPDVSTFSNDLRVVAVIEDRAAAFLSQQACVTSVDGSTLSPQTFLRALIGFLVARTDYVRGMSLDSLTLEREVVKAAFRPDSDRAVHRIASSHLCSYQHRCLQARSRCRCTQALGS